MKTFNFLAFDVGATSGRGMLATVSGDSFEMKEIYRFPNAIMNIHGKYYWDIFAIYDHLKKALAAVRDMGVSLDSIGIDTWGCDCGYIGSDGTLLGLPRAYRDQYTAGMPEKTYQTVPRDVLYARTGIQILNFNSLFQVLRAKEEGFTPRLEASKMLFIPDLLSYFCTGRMYAEYTVASTSQMLNATTRTWDTELLARLGAVSGRGNLFQSRRADKLAAPVRLRGQQIPAAASVPCGKPGEQLAAAHLTVIGDRQPPLHPPGRVQRLVGDGAALRQAGVIAA